MPDPEVNIVGVGNVLMGDDGAGVAAVEVLAHRRLPPGAALHDAGLAVSDVLGRLDPATPLVVLDALRAGDEPGSVYTARFDELALLEPPAAGAISLHELSIAAALRMEALSGRAFADVTVFGIEPARVEWGAELTPPVADAVRRLADAVVACVTERIGATSAGAEAAGTERAGAERAGAERPGAVGCGAGCRGLRSEATQPRRRDAGAPTDCGCRGLRSEASNHVEETPEHPLIAER